MAATTIYERLLSLPLFMGMGQSELESVAGNTKFDFLKLPENHLVADAGAPCDRLYFLTGGRMKVSTLAADSSYQVTEDIHAPLVFEPERLFGIHQRYAHRYETLETCHLISLTKEEVMRLEDGYLVFRLNFLNLISARSQRSEERTWRPAPASLQDRILRFFSDHVVYPAGRKEFAIRMSTLAQEMGDSRLDVSHALHALQEDGQVELYRGRIVVPALEKCRLFV